MKCDERYDSLSVWRALFKFGSRLFDKMTIPKQCKVHGLKSNNCYFAVFCVGFDSVSFHSSLFWLVLPCFLLVIIWAQSIVGQ